MAARIREDRAARGARSIQRIVDAAATMFGRKGIEGASMNAVARAAGVSKALLHYHFASKEHLLLEAIRATFRQVHRRFDERFQRGERGVSPAIEALDALWDVVYEMKEAAPFLAEILSLTSHEGPLKDDVDAFVAENTRLLEHGIKSVFPADQIAIPPERLARMVRVGLYGLVLELAQAETPEDYERIDQSYRDMRQLFALAATQGTGVPALRRRQEEVG